MMPQLLYIRCFVEVQWYLSLLIEDFQLPKIYWSMFVIHCVTCHILHFPLLAFNVAHPHSLFSTLLSCFLYIIIWSPPWCAIKLNPRPLFPTSPSIHFSLEFCTIGRWEQQTALRSVHFSAQPYFLQEFCLMTKNSELLCKVSKLHWVELWPWAAQTIKQRSTWTAKEVAHANSELFVVYCYARGMAPQDLKRR